MNKTLDQYLLEAQGKAKTQLPGDNPFRDCAFDGDKPRLGWVKALPFSAIEESLQKASGFIQDKEFFVFVGMGGSINGIKTAIALHKKSNLLTLDSLDPLALKEVLSKISLEKTLVVVISKSGTTQESQLLASALREVYAEDKSIKDWKKHFLFLADPNAFEKIDALGWQGVTKIPIQCDGKDDIGGRFSAPHTFLFLFPLFLCLNRDKAALRDIYNQYIELQTKILQRALELATLHKSLDTAFFAPYVQKEIEESFSAWIVQLFQESIGSKKKGVSVKTFCTCHASPQGFVPVKLDFPIDCDSTNLMAQMYFYQAFVAFFSALKGINFVSQEFVEKYKQEMKKLQSQGTAKGLDGATLKVVIKEIQMKITPAQKFIEIVLFSHASSARVAQVKKIFSEAFKDRMIFVFIGSDWNHHSYQAAFADENTFFALLANAVYETSVPPLSSETILKNVKTLIVISQATYLTMIDKAVLHALTD